jgi:hypothetical protein
MRTVILLAAVTTLVACSPIDRPKLKREMAIAATEPSAASAMPAHSDRLPRSPPLPATVPAPPLPSAEFSNAVADATVTVEVKTALSRDHELQAVALDTVNGNVVLRGEVASPQARERAVWVASHVAGVRTVHDDLRVDRTYLR